MSPSHRHPDEIVVTTSAAVRRRHELRMVAIFLVAALPVALILLLIVNLAVAVVYVVVQTVFLWFGVRRRQSPILRLSPEGLSYEPGQFHLRCSWADVDALGEVDLPDGRVEALVLAEGHLHWAADATTRRRVEARGWDRIIPIGSFEPDWEWGAIGQAVRDWAPWVFELGPPDDSHP